MLPKNLLSFIALHALTIIRTTLAMKIPDQPMDVCEEINSVENTLMAGTLEFGNGSDEEQCRQNKETIGLMNEDVEMIRRHIGYLEESKEPIHLEFLNQLEQIDSHLLKHIGAKIEDLGGEQNLISSVMHKRKPSQLGEESTQSDLGEGQYRSMESGTLGIKADQAAGRVEETKDLTSSRAYGIMYEVSQILAHWQKEQLVHIWNNLQTQISNYKIVSKEYETIEEIIHTFEPNTIFKMAMLDLELKSKIPRGSSSGNYLVSHVSEVKFWKENQVEIYLQPFIKDLSKPQQKIIHYRYFKEYYLICKYTFKTGFENFDLILQESSQHDLLTRLDHLSSEIHSAGISTSHKYKQQDLVNEIKNCFESFDRNQPTNLHEMFNLVVAKFNMNYYFIDFIKNFYKNIFDKLKPVDDHEGNSLLFEAKLKLVGDFLIYAHDKLRDFLIYVPDKVGDPILNNLVEHYQQLISESKPGSATYFDWSCPLISSLLKR
ncbi:hypothetical protein MJO29_013052 [Puccinia striiformis f. sp. tritici]|nr:hypothetical protein MJO29_013052 [Puccinia striiformis f. sp. tritici]KAI9629777.1 hypothetical protein KEM48_012603 [Puccinia striiformis f. sp. tritici PST-130]